LLNPNELVDATNARVENYGAVAKRSGSKRMHVTALPAAIRGLFQWDSPSGKQVVAISNGDLYHKTSAFGDFTFVDSGATPFSAAVASHFVPFRAVASGAPLVLYAASGTEFWKWTGAALTRITGVNAAPAMALLAPYHTRGFAVDAATPKRIYWSRIGDMETWSIGLPSDGGNALVDVLTGDSINAIDVIGGSLLIFTKDAVVRFSGYSSDDIQIAQDTSGVSSEVGVVGDLALQRVEQVIAFISDRGPYFALESGVTANGIKIENDFDNLDRANLSKAVVGHHRQRREIWYAVAGAGDGGLNKTVFVYNYRLQAWYGPFTYPYGITALARYEDANGAEWLMSGGNDGFVRHMDLGALDDVLADGTGGSTYTMTVELSPMFFEVGPRLIKALDSFDIEADLPIGSALVVKHAFDSDVFTSETALISTGSGIQPYRLDANTQGKRLRVQLVDASVQLPEVAGITASAFNMNRR
jgi:hypothetical protein